MTDFQAGDQVWIINVEEDDEFYLLAKQTIVDFMEGQVVCEDDFNTFHVAHEDIYRSKAAALDEMIRRLSLMRQAL